MPMPSRTTPRRRPGVHGGVLGSGGGSPQVAMAQSAANTLGLEFEHVRTGFGELQVGLATFAKVSILEN